MTRSETSPNGGTKMADDIATRPPAPAAVVQWLLTGANEHDVLEALRAKYRRMLEVGDFDGARKVLKNITEVSL